VPAWPVRTRCTRSSPSKARNSPLTAKEAGTRSERDRKVVAVPPLGFQRTSRKGASVLAVEWLSTITRTSRRISAGNSVPPIVMAIPSCPESVMSAKRWIDSMMNVGASASRSRLE